MKLDGVLYNEKTVYVPQEKIRISYSMFEYKAADDPFRSCFGLAILLDGLHETQECTLFDIATSQKMAMRIWDLFTEGLVTPCTAKDIMEELLSDASFLWEEL